MVNNAYSHGALSGVQGCSVGSCVGKSQPNNEMLCFFSSIEGFVLVAIIAGLIVFGMYVIWNNRPRKQAKKDHLLKL